MVDHIRNDKPPSHAVQKVPAAYKAQGERLPERVKAILGRGSHTQPQEDAPDYVPARTEGYSLAQVSRKEADQLLGTQLMRQAPPIQPNTRGLGNIKQALERVETDRMTDQDREVLFYAGDIVQQLLSPPISQANPMHQAMRSQASAFNTLGQRFGTPRDITRAR